ncbi:MAG: ATP-binding protein [Actinomycetota bacterium]
MTARAALIRSRSLRFRITAAFVLAAAILTTALSVATLVTVRRFLEDQRIRSSTRQTIFAVLFAREYLGSRPDLEGLASKLQVRPNFDAMVTADEQWFATSLELTPDSLPGGLRSLIEEERFGYEITPSGEDRVLVLGSPLPPDDVDLYLFFPMVDIDQTVSLLSQVLIVIGVAIVGVAALFARQVSTRLLYPLSAVSAAAQRMADGLLETRVEPTSTDELGQLAASFNRMADALHQKIRREREFVAGVSHELRTPLAALSAAGDVLRRHEDSLPHEGKEALALINEDLVALRLLVEELMEISELDAGRPTLRVEEVRLRPFVEALLRRRHREALLGGPDLAVNTDKARLERIIGNLIENAYTHGDGKDVRVRVEADGDDALVTVSDRGPGVDPDDQALIFDRFFKPDRSRTRERGGVGLGLAIARENAQLVGGSIDVVSTPGEGASFTVRLPRGAPEADRG